MSSRLRRAAMVVIIALLRVALTTRGIGGVTVAVLREVILQLLHGVNRMLGAQRRITGAGVALAGRAVTGRARGNVARRVAGLVQRFACLPGKKVGLEARGRLRGEVDARHRRNPGRAVSFTMGYMSSLMRLRSRIITSCSRTYAAFWPAMFGHSGLTLLPFTPWQAVHTAALLAPASAEPTSESAARAVLANARPAQMKAAARLNENLLSIMVLRAP